jgi:geranylgeranyl diphosphate synthase type II
MTNETIDLQKLINSSIAEIDLKFQPQELYEPIKYSLSVGGKRLRPLLTLIASSIFDGKIEDTINLALGLEIFHNFTLVHDDIMDNAPIRRGKETVYKKWNQNIAILSGDTMFALAYQYVSKVNSGILPEVLDVFTTTARQVCEGQQFDMNFESEECVSIPAYIEMIRLKTGVLLGCCLKAGALCGGASKEQAQNLYEFGVNLGISFQIMDDYLDVFGNEADFGKLNCGDIIARKKTFLYLKAIAIAGEESINIIRDFNDRNLIDADRVSLIKSYYIKYGIKAVAEAEMDKYYKKGLDNIAELNLASEKLNPLLSLSAQIMNRAH